MGNRLSKIYTRTGDDGSTGLGDGSRVAKDSPRVDAYGTVDEANSCIGLVLAGDVPDDIRQLLTAVWGPAHEADVQYLRVFVAQLRQKVEPDPAAPTLITTEPGVGYRWTG